MPSVPSSPASTEVNREEPLPHTPTRAVRNTLAVAAQDVGSSSETPSPSQILSRMRLSYASPHTPTRPSPRHHDRFIPSSTSIHSFRMGSPVNLLTSEEKLLRRSTQSTSRTRSSSPERNTAALLNSGPPHVRTASPVLFRTGQTNRRISAGAIGIFGIGVGVQSRRETTARQRGREVNGNIFADKESPELEMERHEKRLSAALGVDRSAKVLSFVKDGEANKHGPSRRGGVLGNPKNENTGDILWEDILEAQSRESTPQSSPKKRQERRTVPTTPFRVLDAPGLRDDYYCSLIAYSPLTHSLAVGLHSDVYSWTESTGARPFESWSTSHVTSLSFSCVEGENNILAVGRIDGSLTLWNPGESSPRLDQSHSAGIACLAWKPVLTPSARTRANGEMAFFEELLCGDELGTVFYYSVEWNGNTTGTGSHIPPLDASMTLLRRIVLHTQQICGLAWSGDGEQFATGGNDNLVFLFNTADVVSMRNNSQPMQLRTLEGGERYRWTHGAAVKAIAFCPWQRSLLATGGGSNDRCIHFFHTFSGAPLATINVSAQVTSLLWSTNHREIAATFGYANPDHPIRIAVFSWPECKQVVQVPWQEDMRALYAVLYPGGPAVSEGSMSRVDDEEDELDALLRDRDRNGNKAPRRRDNEGCIVVAASDETVRFHEVWSPVKRGVLGWRGVLGGSDILEELEGIDRDGAEMIR